MIHQIDEGYVRSETHRDVMTIEFYHPQGNSLPSKILDKLTEKIHFASYNDECKMIVLRSAAEGAFCGGALFDELGAQINVLKNGRAEKGQRNIVLIDATNFKPGIYLVKLTTPRIQKTLKLILH